MRRKIREKGELERTRERKEKELEVQTHGFYFYKVSVPYMTQCITQTLVCNTSQIDVEVILSLLKAYRSNINKIFIKYYL